MPLLPKHSKVLFHISLFALSIKTTFLIHQRANPCQYIKQNLHFWKNNLPQTDILSFLLNHHNKPLCGFSEEMLAMILCLLSVFQNIVFPTPNLKQYILYYNRQIYSHICLEALLDKHQHLL